MKTLRHVMIDLETMGKIPEQAIVSVGAVIFDPRYNKVSKDTFYMELAWRTQDRLIDPDTQAWWKQQSKEARASLNGKDSLQDCLDELSFWLPEDCKVWGNGATFDISTLEHAYRQHKQEIPWKFWNVRDCRTIKDLYESARGGFDKKVGGIAHNALHDAIHQAEYICYMWNKILNP